MNKSKKIIRNFFLCCLFLILVASSTLLYEQLFDPVRRPSNTLIPMSVITSYIVLIFHLFLYHRNMDDNDSRKPLIRKILKIIGWVGLLIMSVSFFIGGYVFRFQICCQVFSIAFIPWLSLVLITLLFYFLSSYKQKMFVKN